MSHSERIGTHHVMFGTVADIFIAPGGVPLIYTNRAYGKPVRIPLMTHELRA